MIEVTSVMNPGRSIRLKGQYTNGPLSIVSEYLEQRYSPNATLSQVALHPAGAAQYSNGRHQQARSMLARRCCWLRKPRYWPAVAVPTEAPTPTMKRCAQIYINVRFTHSVNQFCTRYFCLHAAQAICCTFRPRPHCTFD